MPEVYGLEPDEEDSSGGWEISLESPELDHLREKYSDIPNEQFNRIVTSSVNILSRCPNPQADPGRETGLVIGKIQSGKTLSFTSLIGLAASNGYRIIVVLAGTKKSLLDQTYERLRRDLGITNPQITSGIYIQKNPRTNITEGVINALESGRCTLFVVQKNATRIDGVKELIEDLPRTATLIIDDEGDEASLNNYFRSGRQSSTYRSIMELRNTMQNHAYIAYTATPQANLLLSTINGLVPEFCELIEPGEGYCGGSEFFGPRIDNYIRTVDDVDEGATEDGRIPDSLKDALAIFFVGAVIRHLRSHRQKHSMLIHLSVSRSSHARTHDSVSHILRTWKDRLRLRQNDPGRIELVGLFRRAYDDLSTTVNNIEPWDTVKDRLICELSSYELHMVNSLPQGVQIAESSFQLENNIVIGGNILSRGLTIQELAVSYMARRARGSTNADTVEQRARWFGYKRDYLDLCRIFIPPIVRQDFEGLLVHEDDFWDSLRRNLNQGIPLNQWPRMLILDTQLGINPTRSSVARFRRFRPQGWTMQRIPIPDQSIVEENKRKIDRFFRSHHGRAEDIGTTSQGGTAHLFVRDCPTHDVISLIRDINTIGTDWDTAYIVEYLERLQLQENVLPHMDVVCMQEGTLRIRALEDNGKINELMQGQSSNYPGDRKIHDNKVQLQIHCIQCQTNGEDAIKTTALALYVPNQPQYNLSFIIRGEE